MEALEKNQVYTAEITGYSSTGAGVCRVAGRAIFVDFALIGEIWEVLILKVTSTAVFGKGLRLVAPSPERIEPECPHFGKCGGCDLRHMSYREELNLKRSRVNDAVLRIAGLDFPVAEIIPAEECELDRYRNKVIFNFTTNVEGKAVAGFFRRRSHDLVPVEDCLLSPELSLRAARALCDFLNHEEFSVYDEKTRKGTVRQLFIRCAVRREGALAVIVSAKGFHGKNEALVEQLRAACPELTGIVLCINKSEGNTVLQGKYHTLWGKDFIEDELCGLTFCISAESFYQINPPQAEKLYNRARDLLDENTNTLLDLYCGTGTIALSLADCVNAVYGAEIIASAVENARENASRNSIENASFICGDAAEAAAMLSARGLTPQAVVVDPPRKGLSPELITTIRRMEPKQIIYISCDPATLARDLKELSKPPYALKALNALDMFPRTCHVETVVLLSRNNY